MTLLHMTDMANPDDTSTDDSNTPVDDATSQPPSADTADDEAAKWKALARKHEREKKAQSAELEKLRRQQLSEDEQALAEARDAGRAEGIAAGAERVAAAELKAALAGVVPNPAEIIEDLTLSRFLTEDADVDPDKVAALVSKYEGLTTASTPPVPPTITPPGTPHTGVAGAQTAADAAKARRERLYPGRKPAA